MGAVGELFALAGLHIDKGSFAAYAAELNAAEQQISAFSSASQTAMAGAFLVPATVLTGVAAYGASIGASYESAGLKLETLYGSQQRAREEFQWLSDFAASTPFEFPELLEVDGMLKNAGLSAQEYIKGIGDASAAQGKSIGQATEAIVDAMTGEYERLKEFGMTSIDIASTNYEKLGLTVEDVGKRAIMAIDKNGKQQVMVVDKNNKEMIASTILAFWNDKYAGAMEKQSQSINGMYSTIKDNIKNGLAELAGFDMSDTMNGMKIETFSLLGVLKELAGVAVSVTGAFASMSEPMQTFVIVTSLGIAAIGALAAGFMIYGSILSLVASVNAAYTTAATASTVVTALFGTTLSAAIWPATLIVGALALVAAGLVYLDQKTGIVTYSWNLMKDVFTIVADGIMRSGQILWDFVVNVVDGIKQAILDMFPAGFLEGVSNVVGGIIDQFSNLGINIHTQAEGIRTDNENIGTSTTEAGNQVTGAADVISTGYDNVGLSSITAGQNVQAATGQIVEGNQAAGQSATQMGADTGTATNQMAGGFSLVTANAVPMVYAIQSGVSPVNALRAAISGATSVNYAYSASFKDVSGMASEAASAAISAANRIGSAIKTNISQVGQLEALAGKWNTRAKLGITSGGGSGTGEGNVKVIAAPKTTMTKTDPTSQSGWSVNISNYNNYASSASKSSIKAVS